MSYFRDKSPGTWTDDGPYVNPLERDHMEALDELIARIEADSIGAIDPSQAGNGFLREGSIRIYRSVEGTGIAPGIDAYPHQYLDIGFNQEPLPIWQQWALSSAKFARQSGTPIAPIGRSGDQKYPGLTPLGTSVATLRREGHDMLAAACGYCGRNISKCAGDCSA